MLTLAEKYKREVQEEKIERVLSWADERSWFNTDFIFSLKDSLDDYPTLTLGQEAALDGIINKFEIW